jgi:hypothetical protein
MTVNNQSEFVIKKKKLTHSSLLTPLNLPKGEISDTTFNLILMLKAPPLEGLGEVKTSVTMAIFSLKIMF